MAPMLAMIVWFLLSFDAVCDVSNVLEVPQALRQVSAPRRQTAVESARVAGGCWCSTVPSHHTPHITHHGGPDNTRLTNGCQLRPILASLFWCMIQIVESFEKV
jgi:hypothetical protein